MACVSRAMHAPTLPLCARPGQRCTPSTHSTRAVHHAHTRARCTKGGTHKMKYGPPFCATTLQLTSRTTSIATDTLIAITHNYLCTLPRVNNQARTMMQARAPARSACTHNTANPVSKHPECHPSPPSPCPKPLPQPPQPAARQQHTPVAPQPLPQPPQPPLRVLG